MVLREIKSDDMEKIGRLFARGSGEEVLRILNKAFYDTISFTSSDTHTMAFKEGQRDIVNVFRNAVQYIKEQEESNG